MTRLTIDEKRELFFYVSKWLKDNGFIQDPRDERLFKNGVVQIMNCPHKCGFVSVSPITVGKRNTVYLREYPDYKSAYNGIIDFIKTHLK